MKAMGGDERLAANEEEESDVRTLMLREAVLNRHRPDMHFNQGGRRRTRLRLSRGNYQAHLNVQPRGVDFSKR